jgi:hypothetical protein
VARCPPAIHAPAPQAWIHRAREPRKGASSGSALPNALPDRFHAPPKPVQTSLFAGHFQWS